MQDIFIVNKWIWVDYGIAAIVMVSALGGFLRGFLREFLALLIWLIALWSSYHYSQPAAVYLQHHISNPQFRTAAAALLVFLGVMFCGSFLGFFLGRMLQKTPLSFSARFSGLLLGFTRGTLIALLLVLLAGLSPLAKDAWWKQSQFIPTLHVWVEWLKGQMPVEKTGLLSR
jgi:membrane protein required for colicin V production